MARVLVGGDWYDGLASDTFLEGEYERIILANAGLLYPDFFAVRFNKVVEFEDSIKKPDFALISQNYGYWWIVEVELAHHPLGSHILPQVAVFSQATYTVEDARFMERQDGALDLVRLREMMKGEQPRVLVIVNQPRPEWVQHLRPYNAVLAVAEVFRNREQKHIIFTDGAHPKLISPSDVLSTCSFDKLIPRFLVLSSPARLTAPASQPIPIEFEGSTTEWVKIGTGDRVWLSPTRGQNPLPAGHRFELVEMDTGRLCFRVLKSQRSRSHGDSA